MLGTILEHNHKPIYYTGEISNIQGFIFHDEAMRRAICPTWYEIIFDAMYDLFIFESALTTLVSLSSLFIKIFLSIDTDTTPFAIIFIGGVTVWFYLEVAIIISNFFNAKHKNLLSKNSPQTLLKYIKIYYYNDIKLTLLYKYYNNIF